jgi:hypothetical protein
MKVALRHQLCCPLSQTNLWLQHNQKAIKKLTNKTKILFIIDILIDHIKADSQHRTDK